MSLSRWRRVAVFAAFVGCGCGGSVEAGSEHAATQAQALVVTVPGRIEAESYERSLDSTPGVNLGSYVSECDRKDGVDIDRSDDPNDGGCVIGWTTAGEWLEYDIQVPSTQTVDITARVASDLVDRQFHISIDGVSLAGQTLLSDTGWAYTDVTSSGIALSAGAHVLRFTFDSDSINLNYIDVTPASPSAAAGPLVETLLPAASAVASSLENNAFPASFVIDGNPTTRWSSAFTDPQWIYVDLGATKQVSRVILNWEVAASQSYEIGVSDSSGGPWTVVYTTTTGDGGLDDITFAPVAARYVRMYSKARTTYFGVSLYDFDVYGLVAPDPTCTPDITDAPDDGANVPTGSLSVAPTNGPPKPAPVLSPSWIAPDGKGCGTQCFNGSVLDGNTLAATANQAFTAGSVSIYVKGADGTWSFQAQLSNPELEASVRDITFGRNVALSGDELISSGTFKGVSKVYVFVRSGASWVFKQALLVSPAYYSRPALEHGTALITTDQDVRVFERGPNGFYRLQTVFDLPPGSPPLDFQGQGFGGRVALDNNVAVIGANTLAGSSASSAFVYERCGALWSFAQQLPGPGGIMYVDFGAAVAVSGTQIAVGEPYASGPSNLRSGAVQTFLLQGSHWVADQLIVNPILEDGSPVQFGTALALHNHLLLVSFVESNPFFFGGYDTLFDVNGAPRFLAALSGANSQTVQISGHQALLNPYGRRIGTDPSVFDLPQ